MAVELIAYDDNDREKLRAAAASLRATAELIASRAEGHARYLEQLADDSTGGPIEANRVRHQQLSPRLRFAKQIRNLVHGGKAVTSGDCSKQTEGIDRLAENAARLGMPQSSTWMNEAAGPD